MPELKGHEEPRGATARARRRARRVQATARTWLDRRASEARRWPTRAALLRHHRRRPGRHRAGRAAEAPRRADHHPGEERARRHSWRNRYKSLVLHDPVWYDHLPYLPFPRSLAGVHAQGPDGRLAGDCMPGSWSSDYWASSECLRPATIPCSASGLVSRARTRATVLRSKAAGLRDRLIRPAERARLLPGAGRFAGMQYHSSRHVSGDRFAGKNASSSAPTVGPRHVRRPLGARRRRDHGAAFADHRREVGDADGAWFRRISIPSRRCATA